MGVFDFFKSNNATKVKESAVDKATHTLTNDTRPSTETTTQSRMPYLFGTSTEDFSFLDRNIETAKKIEVINNAVSYIARWFSQGELQAFDKDGNQIEDDILLSKIENPNPNQSKYEFLSQWAYFTKANGKSFIKPYTNSIGFEKDLERTSLYNLNPDNVKEFLNTKSIFELDKANDVFLFEEIISKHKYQKQTLRHIFKYQDTLVFVDNINVDGSDSILSSLKDEVKNIYLAQKGKYNKLKHSGTIVVSPNNKEETASLGLDKPISDKTQRTQKDLIEDRIRTSSTTSDESIIVSATNLKAQNLTEGLNALDYDKEVVEDYRRIYKNFGIPDELSGISEKEKSTSSFGDNGNKLDIILLQFLQNTIEPLGDLFANTLTNFYDNGNTYKMSYNHLTPYQISESKKTEQKKKNTEAIILALNSDLISLEDAKEKYNNN